MAEKKNGGLAFLSNPKSRMMVIGAGAVIVAGLALAVNGLIKKNSLEKDQAEPPSTAALPADANKKEVVIDPTKVDAKQSELRKAANEDAAKKADSNGQTFIATMRPDAGNTGASNPEASVDPTAYGGRNSFNPNAFGSRVSGPREPTEQEIREAEAAQQKKVDEWKRKLTADKSKINDAWEPGSRVFYTAYVGDESKAEKKAEGAGAADKSVPEKAKKRGQVLAKAGDLYYGTIDIGMNTDEPSAVTAYILNGPFKGGKLIGAMAGQTAPYSEKAVIQFTLLNHPKFEHSQAVKIFAVDRNTKRAAVADSVDRHLFAKFGLAAAVDFAQGYAEGKAQVATTVNYGQNGAPTVITQPELTNKQLIARGAARTMSRVANTLEPYTNRPNTLEVYSGTEVGLLVAGDVVYVEGGDDADNVAANSKANTVRPDQQMQPQVVVPANAYTGRPPAYGQPWGGQQQGYPSQPAFYPQPSYGQQMPYGQMPAYGPIFGPQPIYGR